MMNVAVDSTTVMRMPSAPTLSRDTAAPASQDTWGMGPSAEVGFCFRGELSPYLGFWCSHGRPVSLL
jgi:hypothetical protein